MQSAYAKILKVESMLRAYREDIIMKRKFKKPFIIALIAAILLGSMSGIKTQPVNAASKEGKVINIYCYSSEFPSVLEKLYTGYKKVSKNTGTISNKLGEYTVKWHIMNLGNRQYVNAINKALKNGKKAAADKKIDIFLAEPEYIKDYADSSYTLPLSKIGITKKDTDNMYLYTKQLGTSKKDKKLHAASWLSEAGVFAYRRSIAKDVFGTDNPDELQKLLNNWSSFDSSAAKVKEKGYFMLSGIFDSYKAFEQNRNTPWVTSGNKLNIDRNMWNWVEQSKIYNENGYSHKTDLWDKDWVNDQSPKGNVFGFFYSAWGVDFILESESLDDNTKLPEKGNGIYGDWAICEGPAPYYWGGNFICVANCCDNKKLAGDIIKKLACNKAIAQKYSKAFMAPSNHMGAMKAYSKTKNAASDFLDGQNEIIIYHNAARKINAAHTTKYDYLISAGFSHYMSDYIYGNSTKEHSLSLFYKYVKKRYPNIKVPK